MVKVRVLKKGENAYLELPKEFLEFPELELFHLRDGYYMITTPLDQNKEKKQVQKKTEQKTTTKSSVSLTQEERAVLTKLLSIRFEKRIPNYVHKLLNDQEKNILAQLEKKRHVNVFKGKKYKDGVYNINDRVYPYISASSRSRNVQKQTTHQKSQPKQEDVKTTTQSPSELHDILMKKGFVVVGNKRDAELLSARLENQMKKGFVKGMKGFDGKFYIATKRYLTRTSGTILKSLDKEMNLDELASATKLDKDGCVVTLRVLNEEGEIMERKKGVFAKV